MMSNGKRARLLCVPLMSVCLLGAAVRASAQTASPAENKVLPGEQAAGSSSVLLPGTAFSSLFGDTIRDFRRLPSRDTIKWLGIGALFAAAGHSVDRPVSRGLFTASRLGDVFGPGQTIGGARLQFGGAAATYAIGRIARSPKVALVGADLLHAQIMAQTLTSAVKLSVRRTRPDGARYSFPSGHASVTFASATVLQRDLGWKVGIPAYGVATYVAASRIQDGRHFLSDVTFGAILGIVAGRTVTVGRGAARFALAPVATSGGAALSLTWVGRQ